MLHIELSIYFIIILTSIIQSLFGVGVLVFGTPLLLIAGLNFVETLNILLPISMVINLFQFLTNRDFIDKKLLENLFFIVLPLISITLFLGIQFIQMNLSLAVGCVLIFIALLNYFKIDFINLINEKIYFSIMSIIHGLTNLGGALLVGIISSKKFNKIKTRTNISFFYFSFAFIQLITLSINDLLIWKVDNLIYLVMGCTLFALTERFIFVKIKETLFVYLTNILLFFLGLLLIIKSL